jgi:glutamate 5-kinase
MDAGEVRRRVLDPGRVRRVVVKLGSSVLTHARRGLREEVIGGLAEQVASLSERHGLQFVVVSSGAIASGRKALGLSGKLDVAHKQAAAAVGQTALMEAYERAFRQRRRTVGQLLLTHADFDARDRYLNARHTLDALLDMGVVPIINENDTVATQEIRLGDNDHLAALVALLLPADLLILLTETDGLFSADPHVDPTATRVAVLEAGADPDAQVDGARAGSVGTGGMASKLHAARLAAARGIPVAIACGHGEQPIEDLFAGKDVGTLVLPTTGERASSRKLWIGHARRVEGTLVVDAGARKALQEGGRSLLPAGVTRVEGEFDAGDVVAIAGPDGLAFARGISGWSSAEVAAGLGRKTAEVRTLLGDEMDPEVVHRDNLTLLP